jgi:hypothetical protein
VPDGGSVTPAIVSVFALLAVALHVPPLSARRIATVVLFVPVVVAVAEQLVQTPPVRPIVGVEGTWKAVLNWTVIVSPAAIAPVALGVKPTDQVSTVPGVCAGAEKVTAVTDVEAVIVTPVVGLWTRSELVAALNVLAARRPVEAGLVIPFTRTCAAVLAFRAQAPPLSARVTVTVVATVEPVAEQVVNPLTRVIEGVAGTVSVGFKTTVIVPPAASAPEPPVDDGLVVNPKVQLASAFALVGLAAMVTVRRRARIVTPAAGLTFVASPVVRTVKLVFGYACEPSASTFGFVMLAIVRVAAVFAARTHDAPASVIVTVLPDVVAVAVQLVNAAPSPIVGLAGSWPGVV